MTRKQVADDLGFSVATLSAWARAGIGPEVWKPGKREGGGKNAHVRYWRPDYEKWKGGDRSSEGPQGLPVTITNHLKKRSDDLVMVDELLFLKAGRPARTPKSGSEVRRSQAERRRKFWLKVEKSLIKGNRD